MGVAAVFSSTMRNLWKEEVCQFTTPWLVDHSTFEAAFGADMTPHREPVEQAVARSQEHPPNGR